MFFLGGAAGDAVDVVVVLGDAVLKAICDDLDDAVADGAGLPSADRRARLRLVCSRALTSASTRSVLPWSASCMIPAHPGGHCWGFGKLREMRRASAGVSVQAASIAVVCTTSSDASGSVKA